MRPRVLTTHQLASVVAKYESGRSLRQLASEYGVSTEPIVRALREAGTPRRSTNNPSGRAAVRLKPCLVGRCDGKCPLLARASSDHAEDE